MTGLNSLRSRRSSTQNALPSHVRRARPPGAARIGSIGVYRIVERTADQITGGMTIVIQAV